MATGSYEESLSMEVIPDHHEASSVTGRRSRWSWQVSTSSNSYPKPKAEGTTRKTAARTKVTGSARVNHRRFATGVTEARSHRRRGKKTPTLVTQKQNGRETNELQFSVACFSIRRSGLERRETFGSPVVAVRSLRLRGASPLRKWRERAGNTRGAGARSSIGWQISVGRIECLLHREVARPVGGKLEGASQEEVRSVV